MDLILGLLTPDSGAVLIDGREGTPQASQMWRERVGYVPQESFLLDDSLAANIAFGIDRGDWDSARIERVVEIAQLADAVSALPQGLESIVGDRGSRLSGGQRQRIGIARALYRSPEVLVIDEGTNALDPTTERMVMEALSGEELTVLWVTHRLETVRSFETILVFAEGRLVGCGSHEALMSDCPAYSSQLTEA